MIPLERWISSRLPLDLDNNFIVKGPSLLALLLSIQLFEITQTWNLVILYEVTFLMISMLKYFSVVLKDKLLFIFWHWAIFDWIEQIIVIIEANIINWKPQILILYIPVQLVSFIVRFWILITRRKLYRFFDIQRYVCFLFY